MNNDHDMIYEYDVRLDKIECFRKVNVGIISEVSKTNEFELFSQ